MLALLLCVSVFMQTGLLVPICTTHVRTTHVLCLYVLHMYVPHMYIQKHLQNQQEAAP